MALGENGLRGLDADGIDVDGQDAADAELRRRQRVQAGAAADVHE